MGFLDDILNVFDNVVDRVDGALGAIDTGAAKAEELVSKGADTLENVSQKLDQTIEHGLDKAEAVVQKIDDKSESL